MDPVAGAILIVAAFVAGWCIAEMTRDD